MDAAGEHVGHEHVGVQRRAVLAEVVVDQLDLVDLGRLGRRRDGGVRRHLIGLGLGHQLLGGQAQRPISLQVQKQDMVPLSLE